MHDDETDVKALVRQLARYLRDNPLASDTPDGIASWWLQLDWYVYESAIGAALAWMVQAGFVVGVKGPDGRVRYRRVPTAEAQAGIDALAHDGPA